MTEERFNTLACRVDGNESLPEVIARLKRAGIACEITTASAWWRGLPRTEHSIMTRAKDAERAKELLGPICSTLPEAPISRERKVFIAVALAVILLVALWCLVSLIFR